MHQFADRYAVAGRHRRCLRPVCLRHSPFTATGRQRSAVLGGDIDPLEAYASGESGLTYNETTGVWHYNWQTKKTLAGKCVELTLNLSGDSTTFKFTK